MKFDNSKQLLETTRGSPDHVLVRRCKLRQKEAILVTYYLSLHILHTVCPRKNVAPTNDVPYYKFCFEEVVIIK